MLQIKHLSSYQLPPQEFWAWWCEGLSLVDLTFWLGVWALMVSWTWQLTKAVWNRLDGEPCCGLTICSEEMFGG